MEKENDHVVLNAQEARQARLGRPVLVVLVASMVLVIVAFILSWWVGVAWW